MNEQTAAKPPDLEKARTAAWARLATALNGLEALGMRPAISLMDSAITAEPRPGQAEGIGVHVRRTVDVLVGPCWVVMGE